MSIYGSISPLLRITVFKHVYDTENHSHLEYITQIKALNFDGFLCTCTIRLCIMVARSP